MPHTRTSSDSGADGRRPVNPHMLRGLQTDRNRKVQGTESGRTEKRDSQCFSSIEVSVDARHTFAPMHNTSRPSLVSSFNESMNSLMDFATTTSSLVLIVALYANSLMM